MSLRQLAAVLTCALGFVPAAATAQVGGNLAAPPAVEIYLEITTGPDGPMIAPSEFELVTGEYYRMNVTSDGRADWRLEVDALLENSHLRLLTIDGIEVHLQGMVFRALEFDTAGTAQFGFTPIRPGDYPFSVGSSPPPGGAAAREDAPAAVGRFLVR